MVNTSQYIDAYYIDPINGSDDNIGTVDSPLKTIQKGIDVAGENDNDGNQVYLKGGTHYLERPLEINRYSGEETAYLTIKSAPGENAILDGSQVSEERGLIEVRDVRRINIIGLEIRNAPSHGIEVVNGQSINIYDNLISDTQGMGIRVRGYMAENLPSEGDTSKQSSHIVIEGNAVYNTNLSNSGVNKGSNNWGAGIQAWNADEITIVNNTVGGNYGEGIGLSLVDDTIVANNTVYDNFSVQIYLDNVTDSVVEANLIYSTGDRKFYRFDLPAHGIALANEIYNVSNPESFYLDNNLITRNVIVGADSGIIYGTWAGIHQNSATNNLQGLKNTTISHNTIYDSESNTIRFYADSNNSNIDISNNIFYQESDRDLTTIDSLTGIDFRRNLWFGGDPGDGSSATDIFADPLFVNPGGNNIANYRLQSNSVAIDAVESSNNSDWITDGEADLGALEFGEPVFVVGDVI